MEFAPVEVEVRPEEPKQLGDPQARVERGGDQRPVPRRAGDEEADDLVAAEHPLSTRDGARALAGLQSLNRVLGHPTVAECEADDALQRRQRPSHSLLRLLRRPEHGHQGGDILDTESTDQAWTERWQQMPFQVIAVALERALTALAGFHTALIALDPPSGDPGETKLRGRQGHTRTSRLDEKHPLRARLLDVVADSAETGLSSGHETNRVLAIGLLIDALLHADSRGGALLLVHVSSDLEKEMT